MVILHDERSRWSDGVRPSLFSVPAVLWGTSCQQTLLANVSDVIFQLTSVTSLTDRLHSAPRAKAIRQSKAKQGQKRTDRHTDLQPDAIVKKCRLSRSWPNWPLWPIPVKDEGIEQSAERVWRVLTSAQCACVSGGTFGPRTGRAWRPSLAVGESLRHTD